MTAVQAPRARPRRRGLHDHLVQDVGSRILGGTLPPGALLPRTDDLADQFAVSRGVVREAMRVLAEKGLVDSRQRSGTRVRSRDQWHLVDPEVMAWHRAAGPSLASLRDLTEVRGAIEPYAAALAARRATGEDVVRLHELAALMTASLDDVATHTRADLDLHAAILRATHNELLYQLTSTITEALEASRDVTVRTPGASQAAMPLHLEVIDAIAARDPDRARSVMEDLVARALRDIESVLGETHAPKAQR